MFCPVCNGMIPLEASCPSCGAPAKDEGRPEDWLGPYSPYELTPRAVAASEATDQICPHLAVCPACGCETIISVSMRNH